MVRVSTNGFMRAIAATVAMTLAVPAAAQFSDSYTFLKAVRDRDGTKVNSALDKGSVTILDTKDQSSGEAALHIVTRRRDAVWLNFLLSKGASPDVKDISGNTPLLYAAQIGFFDGAQLLIASRAGIDVTNRAGETPLIRAVQANDVSMVRLLLAAGANPKKTDSVAGMSARDYAARDRRSAVILKMIDEAKPAPPARAIAGPKL